MRIFVLFIFSLSATSIFAQQSGPLPDAPEAQVVLMSFSGAVSALPGQDKQQTTTGTSSSPSDTKLPDPPVIPLSQQQPKRILGIMPNYRAVSAGAIPPPPNAGEAFKLAAQNTFDYSSYVFVGITSLLAEGTDAHPDLGKGIGGFWAYTWRGFVDKTDGNFLVIFALPTILHEDERYFAMGHGRKWKRLRYSLSQVVIARDYHGHNTFNAAEIVGRGAAQAISTTYYPSSDNNIENLTQKYVYALGRDALTNALREFWPDIATHVLHRHS